MTSWIDDRFKPHLIQLRRSAFARSGAFQTLPLAPYELFLAELAAKLGADVDGLRYACFGPPDLWSEDPEDRRARGSLENRIFKAWSLENYLHRGPPLRVERKDVLDAVHHLRGTGSVFDGAQVDHYRGQTYLSAPSDVGEFRLVLRFRVFTGLTPHSDDYVVVYDRRSETSRHLGNFSLRLLLLDYRRPLWTQKADLLAALRTDEAYFAAVLKELDGMGQDHAGRTAGDRLS